MSRASDVHTFGAVPEPPKRVWVEQIMGMPVSLHLRGPHLDSEHVSACVTAAFEVLRGVDARFSTYRADSELSRVRRGEVGHDRESAALREVRELCERARIWSEGWFEATDPEGAFDPTGLVKGWAVQRCHEELEAALHSTGDQEFAVMINAGGDIAVSTRPATCPPWRIGLENPLDRTQLIATVPLQRGGVATSGTAARGEHLWNPRDPCAPPAHWASVSVIGPDLIWADVAATAAFAAGRAAPTWLAGLPGHLSLLVDHAGRCTEIAGPTHG